MADVCWHPNRPVINTGLHIPSDGVGTRPPKFGCEGSNPSRGTNYNNKKKQMNNIDEYGRFVDSAWFGAKEDEGKTELSERDFRVMELGLPGEVGEVLELLKRNVRDGVLPRELLKKELGDVVYYWARICSAYGFKPSEVLQANIDKINDRTARNVRRGSGDER